ncbi:reverse transcriptase family protein [Xenophilus arseniciresistens]|uniref:RNA-directed DNA polymerase n=1 Tax=Xenophilus arseniciresistens TaxID=1283306 RepID=A0AAE3T0W8_9BURK|nr:reverse transcriptase family protein [Xenophilus arseniciresistens]MDA7418010.1 reverse transcriptase family protein [Xenophilus arseniciresistens]
MAAPQPTRAELIERIRASSKEAVVLAEMQRLGFWPKGAAQPEAATELIERETALVQELNSLQAQLQLKGDPDKALRAMRQERLAAARAQRETKARERAQRQYERALQWHGERQQRIGYLGAGVSAGLERPDGKAAHAPLHKPRPERLALHGLPALASPQALAQAMGLALGELRFLSFHREVARHTHYRRFTLPKKSGGERLISAPMPRLKRAQYWVLDNILAKVPAHDAAHGFLPGRSIAGNAQPHCGQDVVINLDVKDFFPSIAFGRIKGVFMHLGYGESVATVLALLCSENRADELQVDGERWFVGGTAAQRVLPQGAPTSPMLTNLLCRRLDRRLAGLARALGFAYTRYADDLSFSASGEAAQRVGTLLRRVRWTLREEGFELHPEKERVMRRGARQEVTGIVVNAAQPGVSRQSRRALRAALHRAKGEGLEQAHWQGQPASRERLLGYAHFVQGINATQGRALVLAAQALPLASRAAHAVAPASDFRTRAAQGQAPARAAGDWWQPAPPPEPVRQRTDGELREARAARRQAAAEARRAAQPTTAAAPSARPGNPNPPAAAANPRPPVVRKRRTYWLQLFVVWLAGVLTGSGHVTLAGLAYLLISYWKGHQRWSHFSLVMLAIVVLVPVARSIGLL